MERVGGKRNIKAFHGKELWKFRIRALLIELNVIHVLEDEVSEEITGEWETVERIAKRVVIEYLSDSFWSFAKEKSTANK